MEEHEAVENYLPRGVYPSGLSKGEKANPWRKCKNNFKLEDGILYYRKAVADGERCALWRICVKTEEDREEGNNGVLPCWIGRQVQIRVGRYHDFHTGLYKSNNGIYTGIQ